MTGSRERQNGGSLDSMVLITGLAAARAGWWGYVEGFDSRGVGTLVCDLLEFSFARSPRGGQAEHADVVLLADGGIRVSDDGVGLPLDMSAADFSWERLFTGLTAGGGAGAELSVVNAFSDMLVVECSRDGRVWRQEFHGDDSWSDLEVVGSSDRSGLCVTFWPRAEFGRDWDYDVIADRVQLFARKYEGASVTVVDERPVGHRSAS